MLEDLLLLCDELLSFHVPLCLQLLLVLGALLTHHVETLLLQRQLVILLLLFLLPQESELLFHLHPCKQCLLLLLLFHFLNVFATHAVQRHPSLFGFI